MTPAARPDLADRLWEFPQAWAQFMYHDLTGGLFYDNCVELYPEYVMLALDGDRIVARSFSVPFAWDGDPSAR